MGALTSSLDKRTFLRRHTLYERAADGPLDEALFTVMAWGLGTTGQWNFMTANTRKALRGRYESLARSRKAVAEGASLEGLWSAHFRNSAPPGLGSVSFGSKPRSTAVAA